MKKGIKETLLGTLVHGKEVLNNIDVLRKTSNDKIVEYNLADNVINKLHQKELHLVVNEIIDTHKNAKIFRLVSEDNYLPPFEAGQYINLFVEIDGVYTSRPYSISSSPLQRAYYEVTIARVNDGFVSSYFLDKVKVGDKLIANGPSGVFHYNKVFHSPKALFIAGGSGITPFMSMLREILSAKHDRDVVLLYGCTELKNALYHDELTYLSKTYNNFKYYLVLSNEVNKDYEHGFISKELITKLVKDYNERTSYICGPQVMNAFVENNLKELNVPLKQIRREMFSSNKNVIKEEGFPKSLTGEEVFNVKVNDQVIKAKANESLLVALERNHIRVNVCCRSGECSLCRVKLVKGKVYLAKGVLLRKADEKFGYIHSCKAYPLTDLEIML